MSGKTVCIDCGEPAPQHFYCDEATPGGPWCTACFDRQPCREDHGEGCETMVFET